MRSDQVSNWLTATGSFAVSGMLLAQPSQSSTLSDILDQDVPARYFLSRKAKDGILRRAAKRGRPLPDLLDRALRA